MSCRFVIQCFVIKSVKIPRFGDWTFWDFTFRNSTFQNSIFSDLYFEIQFNIQGFIISGFDVLGLFMDSTSDVSSHGVLRLDVSILKISRFNIFLIRLDVLIFRFFGLDFRHMEYFYTWYNFLIEPPFSDVSRFDSSLFDVSHQQQLRSAVEWGGSAKNMY